MQEIGKSDGMLVPVSVPHTSARSTLYSPLICVTLIAIPLTLFFSRPAMTGGMGKTAPLLGLALIASGLFLASCAFAPALRRLAAQAVISVANWAQRNTAPERTFVPNGYAPMQGSKRVSPIVAFSAGILATVVIQQMDLSRLSLSGISSRLNAFSIISTPSLTDATAVPRSVVEQPEVTDTKVNAGIARLVAIEPRSPLGRPSAGIMREDALAFADRYLRGDNGAHRHRLEAAYWLKHALSTTLKDPSLTWALTQLGSVFAAPEVGLPDYRSASMVWQVAASLGDPIAYCFLARMHEHGLGVEKAPDAARRLYSHALGSGGCPGLMQSLSRLQ